MRTLFIIAILSLPSLASAQAQDTHPIDIEYVKHETPKQPRTAGLATAVSLSSAGVIGGMMLAIGSASIDHGLGADPPPRNNAMLAGGLTLIGASIGGIVASGIYLHRKREKKRACQHGRCEAPVAIVPGVRF